MNKLPKFLKVHFTQIDAECVQVHGDAGDIIMVLNEYNNLYSLGKSTLTEAKELAQAIVNTYGCEVTAPLYDKAKQLLAKLT